MFKWHMRMSTWGDEIEHSSVCIFLLCLELNRPHYLLNSVGRKKKQMQRIHVHYEVHLINHSECIVLSLSDFNSVFSIEEWKTKIKHQLYIKPFQLIILFLSQSFLCFYKTHTIPIEESEWINKSKDKTGSNTSRNTIILH